MAQPSAADRAAAEALFDQAVKLLEAKQAADACPKLEESQRLDPAVGTLLYLADCYQQVGRTASAWATFREAAYAANAAGQADREKIATEYADKLRPQLSYISLEVSAPDTPGLEIRRDGQVIRKSLWSTPIPVDPGPHRLEAMAPGHAPWSNDVEVKSGPAQVSVPVPQLEVDSSASAAPPVDVPAAQPDSAGVVAAPGTPPPAETDSTPSSGSDQRLFGWIAAGVGGAVLVTSGVFSAMAVADNSAADDECLPHDRNRCNDDGIDLAESAGNKATLATITGGIGLAGVVGGLVLILTAPDDSAAAANAGRQHAHKHGPPAVTAALTDDAVGVFVNGSF